MSTTILWVGFGLAVIDWIAVRYDLIRLEHFAKPAVMVMILVWLVGHAGFGWLLIWFTAGAALSLAGDIFLMPPRSHFMAGMASFGLAYLAYSAGFLSHLQNFNLTLIILAGFLLLPAKEIFQCLTKSLVKQRQKNWSLPFLLYATIISLMLIAALSSLTNQDWEPYPAIWISLGALLLFISDAFLVWNKFIEPLHNGRLSNIITYHLGQLLVAYGITGLV